LTPAKTTAVLEQAVKVQSSFLNGEIPIETSLFFFFVANACHSEKGCLNLLPGLLIAVSFY